MRSFILLLAVLGACSDDNESLVVDLGVITTSFDLGTPIEHPAVAQTNTDIAITVLTYGSDCTWLKRTDVKVAGLRVEIRPFDESAVDSFCGDTSFSYRHTTTVRFDETGTANIVVYGYGEGDRFGSVIEQSSSFEVN